MDSKKRKEKILKQINKEKSSSPLQSGTSMNLSDMPAFKSGSGKTEKSGKTANQPSKKKAMFSNEKALKDDKLFAKIAKEKSAYQKKQTALAENSSKLFHKVSQFCHKGINKVKHMDTVQRYKFFGAWVIVLVILCIVVGMAINGSKESDKKDRANDDKKNTQTAATQADTTQEGEDTDATTEEVVNDNPLIVCDNAAVTDLITNYLAALRDVDMDKLRSLDMCQDTYASEGNYKSTAKVVEDYKDITVYTKNGPYENGYVAYVVTNIKFIDVDKTCQGMFKYIVRQQEDGSYLLDTTNEDDIDDHIIENELITIGQSEDVLALIDSVNQQCQADLEVDATLKNYVQTTLNPTASVEGVSEEATTEASGESTTESTKKKKKKKKKKSTEEILQAE